MKQSLFSSYPDVPWTSGWRIRSGVSDPAPFQTASECGDLAEPGANWTLHLCDPSLPSEVRLFHCGLSLESGRGAKQKVIRLLATSPGVLTGIFAGLPPPRLDPGPASLQQEGDAVWIEWESHTVCLLVRGSRFALASSPLPLAPTLDEAEQAIKEDFEQLTEQRTEDRRTVQHLFSLNSRHNPPVALAAESLEERLRAPRGILKGIWSVSEVPDDEIFSLNELFPLVRAWCLIRPQVALDLSLTALRLQRPDGALPARVSPDGRIGSATPWPLIVQSFELAWRHRPDHALLQRTLPSLRKYIQWAIRYFDPHHDGVPSWQSAAEPFVPGSFERNKATPDLTALLLSEIDALMRLMEEDNLPAQNTLLHEERDRLNDALNRIFWDPDSSSFCRSWKEGHFLSDTSFATFVPLLVPTLSNAQQSAAIEALEETRHVPGSAPPSGWKQGGFDPAGLPAAHLFLAYEILRRIDSARPLLNQLTTRMREGFAAWFERESIAVSRGHPQEQPAYALGPITASMILTVQEQFDRTARRAPTLVQWLTHLGRRLRVNRTDLLIITVFLVLILAAHLVYRLPGERHTEARMAEAALSYQQGRFNDAMTLSLRYPNHPLSQLLQANLFLLAERADQAADLYRRVLLQHPESPSALLGLAVTLQVDGRFDDAVRRYTDFIDIHGDSLPSAATTAATFRQLAREGFSRPPRWRELIAGPLMYTLGL